MKNRKPLRVVFAKISNKSQLYFRTRFTGNAPSGEQSCSVLNAIGATEHETTLHQKTWSVFTIQS